MDIIAVLECSLMEQPSDHEVHTESGQATCTLCGATQVVEAAELLTILA